MSFNISTRINNLYQLILDVSNNIPSPSSGLPSATEYGEYVLYNGTDWITQGGSTTSGNTVKIGRNAGFRGGSNCVLLGNGAGFDSSNNVIAIGNLAGSESGSNAISIGAGSGVISKKEGSIAIGNNSGYFAQGTNSVALGVGAGQSYVKDRSIGIGYLAGRNYNGLDSVCIGTKTEATNYDNSIVISANGTGLNADGSSRCFIDPIRNASNTNVLLYNTTSKEITYDTAVNSANTVLVSNDVADTTCFIPFVNNTPAGSYQSIKAQSALTYNASTSQMGVSKIKPTIIIDTANSGGTAGQALVATGSTITWENRPYIYAFSTTSFTPSVDNTLEKFPILTNGTISLYNQFSSSLTNSRITYTGTATRKFFINVCLQGGLATSGTVGLGFEVRKNGVVVPSSGRSQYARYQNLAGDFKPHMVSQSVVEMSTNQYIEVWCVCTSGASMVANSAFTNYNPTGMTSVPTCIVNISAID